MFLHFVFEDCYAKCFMGSSLTPHSGFEFEIWVSPFEYQKLFANVAAFNKSKSTLNKGIVEKALFVEGSLDSTNMVFDFGP